MELPPTPPNAESDSAATAVAAPPDRQVVSRRYPRPPALPQRLLALCLKPESWPAAAQYPFWVTLLPLIIAVLIAALAVGIGETKRDFASLATFASRYDQHYPPLHLASNGTLSVKNTAHLPIEMNFGGAPLFVDPTGKSTVDTIKEPAFVLVNASNVIYHVGDRTLGTFPIKNLLPEHPTDQTINSASIQHFLNSDGRILALGFGFTWALAKLAGEALWIAIILFLTCPLVMLGAGIGQKALILPKRAAYRIAAALLVPLVLLGGFLQASGNPVSGVVGGQNAQIFWFFAASALAFWAGHLAKRMYAAKTPARRRNM